MKNKLKRISVLCIAVCLLTALVGCGKAQIKETYEYSEKSGKYLNPAMTDGWAEKDVLAAVTADGEFFCFTEDTATADDFINAQRTLLNYLRSLGMEVGLLECYVTDYGFSFSDSETPAIYVDIEAARSWQQVLVTLQTLWGDYTEYGYVYAVANAVAEKLGWQTDEVPTVEKKAMDAFFAENPEAINLLYPTFTTKFASEEAVNCSKALALKLFDDIKWKKASANSVESQLEEYGKLKSDYAAGISAELVPVAAGYAYYGENVPMRIKTALAEMFIAEGYYDENPTFNNYFADYKSIYETISNVDAEMRAAAEYFAVEDVVGTVTIKWLTPGSDAAKKFLAFDVMNAYNPANSTIYVTSIKAYLHEYHDHIQIALNAENEYTWQREIFNELGNANSQYRRYLFEVGFNDDGEWAGVYSAYTGRNYESGKSDYLESFHILTHYYDDFGYKGCMSLCIYLSDIYGEREVFDMLLRPETVEEVTGKTWEELNSEWEQYIRDKYAEVDTSALPEW